MKTDYEVLLNAFALREELAANVNKLRPERADERKPKILLNGGQCHLRVFQR
jgi:hypothetical protein